MGISNLHSLPYAGMKEGLHKYIFGVDDAFFDNFDHSPITNGSFVIELEVEKHGHLSEFVFNIEGKIKTICDRCLVEINLPVTGRFLFHGKVSTDSIEDENIISIHPDQTHIDLSQYLYEMICLSLPLTNVYECELEIPRICDDTILQKLTSDETTDVNKNQPNNVWYDLKGLIEDN